MPSEYVQQRQRELMARGIEIKHKRKRSPNRTSHLTADDCRLIRELAQYRIPYAEIAEKFETSYGTIARIIQRDRREPAK